MEDKIWLSSPHMSGNEMKYIKEAFDSNWIAPLGKNVDQFEKELSDYTGAEHVTVLTSGTAAIHLALITFGVGLGDEVLVSDFTFTATVNPIIYQGAKPILIDSEKDTWNIDPIKLEQAIIERMAVGKRPKAILVVHLYGMPAKMDEIMAISRKYNIPVIEDAAEALGSYYKGKHLGTIGDIGILSFNGNKIITTSGGGAFLSNNIEYIENAKFLSTQARDEAPHYQHSKIGFNYRMSNVLAGIGRGQLEVIEERIDGRRANFNFYKEQLNPIHGIDFLNEPDGFRSNRWLTTITVDPEKTNGISNLEIRLELEKHNIDSRPLWKPMHMQPVYSDEVFMNNNVSAELFKKGLCLPSGTNLSSEQKNNVVKVIHSLFS